MSKETILKVNEISVALWAIAFAINAVVTMGIFILVLIYRVFVGLKQ